MLLEGRSWNATGGAGVQKKGVRGSNSTLLYASSLKGNNHSTKKNRVKS